MFKAIAAIFGNGQKDDNITDRRKQPGYPPRPTFPKCRACGVGEVITLEERVFDPILGPPIIGPGSQNQFQTKARYHCNACGLSYAFPPPDLVRAPDPAPGTFQVKPGEYRSMERRVRKPQTDHIESTALAGFNS